MGPTVPFWAVEIGDSAVNAIRVRRTPDNALEILAWWTAPVVPGVDPLLAAAAILKRKGLRDHGLQLVLPGRGASCRSCRISPDDADASAAELERELFDLTPHEPEDALLRYRRLGGPEVLDFRVVAERREVLVRTEKTFEEAGFRHVGLSLAPVSLLAALESLRLGPPRGYAFEIHGAWSVLTAFEGALSVRHPIPFGLHDVARRLGESGSGISLDAALDAAPGSPAAAALAAAAAPLTEDFRRAVEFHRAAVRGTGDETLLPVGAGMERPGLRALIAGVSPVALAALPLPTAVPGLRLGPGVKPEACQKAFPFLVVPLGAAMAAAGLAPRDLEFGVLPDDLPAPPKGNLFPVAAVLLLASVAGAHYLSLESLDTLQRGRTAIAAIPAPRAGTEGAAPAEAGRQAEELGRLVDEAKERATLRRALTELVAAFPRAAEGSAPAFAVDAFEVRGEGGNFRVKARLRVPAVPGGPKAPSVLAADPLVRSLESAGWRVTENAGGVVAAERLEMKREGPR